MPEPAIQYHDRHVEEAVRLYEKGVPFEQFPDQLQTLFQRWGFAHEIKLKYQHKGDDFVREIYKLRYKLNDTTARQDIRACQMFFGKTKQNNRKYERILRIEFLKKVSYEAFAQGKFKEVAANEAILQKYLDPAHDPIDMPDWEELRLAVQPTIEYNPEILDVERMPAAEVKKLWDSVQRRKNIDISDAVILEETPKTKSAKEIEEENA